MYSSYYLQFWRLLLPAVKWEQGLGNNNQVKTNRDNSNQVVTGAATINLALISRVGTNREIIRGNSNHLA